MPAPNQNQGSATVSAAAVAAAAAVSASYTGPQEDPLDQNVKYTCTAAEGTLASLHGPAHTLTYSHTPERHHPRVPPPEQPLPVNDLHARSYVRTQRKRIEL
mgnify:FL=1